MRHDLAYQNLRPDSMTTSLPLSFQHIQRAVAVLG